MTVNIGLGRSYGRGPEEKRPTKITRHFLDNVPGSCLIETGATKVLCAVSIEERVKAWRKGAGAGWITAEYAMLPASTAKRSSREHLTRKGRSMEIERLIGRSLRSAVDMTGLGGEVTFTVDCDVLQAGVWVVYDNTLYNTTPFVTSDNPVLVEGVGKAATGLFSNGLANPTTCIFYPISPSIAVSLLHPFLLLPILFPFGFC